MSDVKVFIGYPIEEPSEINFLTTLNDDLAQRQQDALVFANFFAGKTRQQIDFFVVTSVCACVVEVKSYKSPVFGEVNGTWELRKPDGTLIKSLGDRNPYHQALSAKYAMNDEMVNLSTKRALPPPQGSKGYLSAMESVVCLFPEIPPGSKLPSGDYRVSIHDYASFLEFLLKSTKNPGFTRADWIELAGGLRLREQGISQAKHPGRDKAIGLRQDYVNRFVDFYGKHLDPLVQTTMTINEESCTAESLKSLLPTEKSVQLIGPSGCGKTHMAKHSAIWAISKGYAPLFIAAKYFRDSFHDLLNKSILHLFPENTTGFLNTIRDSGQHLLVNVDGLNECALQRLGELLQETQGLILRHKATIIFTSQQPVELSGELAGPVVKLGYLTGEEKLEVLSAYSPAVGEKLKTMVGILRTPFEVCLLAESAVGLGTDFTTYTLFNAYARKCLSRRENSSLAFRILVSIGRGYG